MNQSCHMQFPLVSFICVPCVENVYRKCISKMYIEENVTFSTTNYRALLQKMTYRNRAAYGSLPSLNVTDKMQPIAFGVSFLVYRGECHILHSRMRKVMSHFTHSRMSHFPHSRKARRYEPDMPHSFFSHTCRRMT